MINKDILAAQLKLYESGRAKAIEAFEKVKADIIAFNGAIEACHNLLRILESFEIAAQSQEQKEDSNTIQKTKQEEVN